MRKIFTLFAAMLIALTVNATPTNFTDPYYCTAVDAVLGGTATEHPGKFYLEADTCIVWSDCPVAGIDEGGYTNLVTWSITATRACYITVSLDLGRKVASNKHIFQVTILDEGDNEIGYVEEPGESADSMQVKTLNGKIVIPAAGTYKVQLTNHRSFCKGAIKNVILTYAGEAPITDFSTPYSCTAKDATLSGTATEHPGKFYLEADTCIVWSDCPVAGIDEGGYTNLVTWSITATRACYITVSLDLGRKISSNKHIYQVTILDEGDNEIGYVEEPGESADSMQVKTLGGIILIPAAGKYKVQLTNHRTFCKGSIKNVILTYYDDPMNIYLDATVWDAGEGTENYAVWDSEHSRWSKFMTLVAGEDHLYVATMPKNDKQLIFVRLNGNTAKEAPSWDDKWNETNGLTRSGYDNLYTITGWGSGENAKSTGEWSVYGAKYYIAGDFTSWDDEKIPVCDGNSYTITGLTAGVHSFKIVDGGNWYGMSALASIAGGYLYPAGDDAILFKLAAAGDVTITYIKNTELSIEGAIAPDVALNGAEDIFGGWDGEKSIVMTAQEGGVYASKTMALPAGNYNIKVVFEGQWLSCNGANDTQYYITSDNHTVSGLSTDKNPFLLQAEKAGDYTFTWTFATGTLDVTFPSPATDIDNTVVSEKAVKVLRNGQLFIEKDGKTYNVLGTVVK